MRRIVLSWVCWVGLVVVGVVWGLPSFPHYYDWIPYGYELGGLALVLLYLSFGLWSLGFYNVVAGAMRWGESASQNRNAFHLGLFSLLLALGLVWCYVKLMDFSLKLV